MTAPTTEPPRSILTRDRVKLSALHDPKWVEMIAYPAVLIIAGVGNATAAINWLMWPAMFAIPAVFFMEVFAVLLLGMADFRMRLGERAIALRLLSAMLAGGMVSLNWLGHRADSLLAAGFFAGASALGYVVWSIRMANRRRDQLRADGRLPEPPPVYGIVRWVTHPWETWQARALAIQQPELGLWGSLDAVRLRKRIGKYLKTLVQHAQDKTTAEAILAIYSPEKLAAEVAARVDWGAWAEVFAANISPSNVFGNPKLKHAFPNPFVRSQPRTSVAAAAQPSAHSVTASVHENAREARGERAHRGRKARGDRVIRDHWWTPKRDKFYEQYARQLDEGGGEIGGEELARGLGMSNGNARRMRSTKLNKRYVDEVVSGVRTPRGPLPPAIAEEVARRAAAINSPTQELRALTAENVPATVG